MAFRLAKSASTRRLALCNSSLVRSTIAQSVSRVAADNKRIDGDRNQFDMYPAERKPDFFVYYLGRVRGFNAFPGRGRSLCGYFNAYSLEEDGSITLSPKYNLNLPSFLLDHYCFNTSCNGIFYFSSLTLDHALWNPTTCEYKILPKLDAEPPPPSPPDDPPPRLIDQFVKCGMWYSHEDCKVVRLVRSNWEYDYKDHWGVHIELYSLRTNSWKRIRYEEYESCLDEEEYDGVRTACLPGILYHSMFKYILSFNISTEAFSRLPFHDGWLHNHSHILEYKGLLGALVFSDVEDSEPRKYDDHATRKYQVWILRDGLWTRDVVFHIPGMNRPIRFSQDGMLLYFESICHELMLFDCATGKVKYLSSITCYKMIPFAENFAHLNGFHVLRRSNSF